MYELIRVYTKEGHVINHYTPSELTLQMCIDRSRTTSNLLYVAAIKIIDTKEIVGLNASLIMQERVRHGTDTWQSFMNQLTEEWIKGYKIDLFGLLPDSNVPRYPWVFYYPFKHFGLTPHYCSVDNKTIRDDKYRKYDLPDLVISKDKNHPVVVNSKDYQLPDLSNCISITHGLCTRSLYDKDSDELYILDGNRYLFSTTNNDSSQETTLIDFSTLGRIKQIPFSELDIKFQNKYSVFNTDASWIINLPDDISFNTHTVLVVIAGTILFPVEYIRLSNKSLSFEPNTLPINQLIKIKNKASGPEEPVFETTESTYEYLIQITSGNKRSDAFIITIDNPDIYTYISNVTPYSLHYMGLHDKLGSAIRRKSTRQILPYTFFNLDSTHVSYFGDRTPIIDFMEGEVKHQKHLMATKMYKPRDSYQTNPLYFHFGYQDPWKDKYLDPFRDLRYTDYQHIYLVAGKK